MGLDCRQYLKVSQYLFLEEDLDIDFAEHWNLPEVARAFFGEPSDTFLFGHVFLSFRFL